MLYRALLFAYRLRNLVLLAVLASAGAWAQQQTPFQALNPDCKIFFTLTTASAGAQAPTNGIGTSLLIDNHQAGCYGWTVAMSNFGFSALSLHFQAAPYNAGGTGPGTWADVAVCGGTECLGVNPNTSTTSAITTTKDLSPFYRMNLFSRTGVGAVVGVLYGWKVNIASANGGGASPCPGGPNTSVQFRSGAGCSGAANFEYTGTQVSHPDGTAANPGIAFASSLGTGIYLLQPFQFGTRDSSFDLNASGVTSHATLDNDTWKCGEGEGGQRGICETYTYRVTNNARFWDQTITFLNWGDPAGGGAGDRVGVGRFTSDGATAGKIHAAVNDGGAHITFEALNFQGSGQTFAGLGTPANGFLTYCSNCTVTSSVDNTCAGAGTGAFAQRLNGVWKCSL